MGQGALSPDCSGQTCRRWVAYDVSQDTIKVAPSTYSRRSTSERLNQENIRPSEDAHKDLLPGAPQRCHESSPSQEGYHQKLPASVLMEVVADLPQQRTLSRVDEERPPARSTSSLSIVIPDSSREEGGEVQYMQRFEPGNIVAPAAASFSREDEEFVLDFSTHADNGPSFTQDGACASLMERDSISFCDSTSAGSTSNPTDIPESSASALPERERAVLAFLRENGFQSVGQSRRHSLVGSTYALHCAASLGLVRMTQLLLEAGANANQKNSWGQTPIDVARRCNKKGSHDAVLEVLIPYGKV